MLGLIFLFLCGWLIYAGLCRLVFGKPQEREYYIVREYDIEVIIEEVMERLHEEEIEPANEDLCELPDNVILFDQNRRCEQECD
jgi:hypothetical protein